MDVLSKYRKKSGESNSVEYLVCNPLGRTKHFIDFAEAKKYYSSLGN